MTVLAPEQVNDFELTFPEPKVPQKWVRCYVMRGGTQVCGVIGQGADGKALFSSTVYRKDSKPTLYSAEDLLTIAEKLRVINS